MEISPVYSTCFPTPHKVRTYMKSTICFTILLHGILNPFFFYSHSHALSRALFALTPHRWQSTLAFIPAKYLRQIKMIDTIVPFFFTNFDMINNNNKKCLLINTFSVWKNDTRGAATENLKHIIAILH
jgi:hypothetical protein